MERKIVSDVSELVSKSLGHHNEYEVEVNGHKLLAHPQVLSPEYSYSSQFIIKNWDIKPEMTVLDIGTGTGILALFAVNTGAVDVVASDINPYACEIAEKNMRLNNVSDKVTVIQSDLFSNIPKRKFDRIVFNAPYWDKKSDVDNPLTLALYDEDYKTMSRFILEAKEYLKPNGKILLGFSSQGNVDFVEKKIEEAGLTIENKVVETVGHTRILYFLT